MKPILRCLLGALLVLALAFGALAGERPDTLFQYSTINALLHGLYDGDMTFAELARHGDVGLGTLNRLDGELVMLEGTFYQVRTDGRAYPVAPGMATPFAVVTFFDADKTLPLPGGLSYKDLRALLEGAVANANHFQAFRIDGLFRSMKVRSVPAQTRPYRPLAKVVEGQAVFDYRGVKGTLIGFRTPPYVAGLNIPGYHFHFLSEDRSRGGHVLDLVTASGTIEVDEIADFRMALPHLPGFAAADLTGKRERELEKVEK